MLQPLFFYWVLGPNVGYWGLSFGVSSFIERGLDGWSGLIADLGFGTVFLWSCGIHAANARVQIYFPLVFRWPCKSDNNSLSRLPLIKREMTVGASIILPL